jgi:hypothetical protein
MFELTELPAEIVDFPDDELVAALLDDSYYPKEDFDTETQQLLNSL